MSDIMTMGGVDRNTAEQQMAGGCQEFLNARFRARLFSVVSLLLGKSNRLKSLAGSLAETRTKAESYLGTQTIDISKIAGSECRSADFDRRFMPKKRFLLHRWLNVNRAYHVGVALPAIKVFEVEGSYYVRDGNHRVSVAKYHGVRYIDAEVVRVAC